MNGRVDEFDLDVRRMNSPIVRQEASRTQHQVSVFGQRKRIGSSHQRTSRRLDVDFHRRCAGHELAVGDTISELIRPGKSLVGNVLEFPIAGQSQFARAGALGQSEPSTEHARYPDH